MKIPNIQKSLVFICDKEVIEEYEGFLKEKKILLVIVEALIVYYRILGFQRANPFWILM